MTRAVDRGGACRDKPFVSGGSHDSPVPARCRRLTCDENGSCSSLSSSAAGSGGGGASSSRLSSSSESCPSILSMADRRPPRPVFWVSRVRPRDLASCRLRDGGVVRTFDGASARLPRPFETGNRDPLGSDFSNFLSAIVDNERECSLKRKRRAEATARDETPRLWLSSSPPSANKGDAIGGASNTKNCWTVPAMVGRPQIETGND